MRIVVITGANRGVGYGIAKCFHQAGDKVIALNRTFCQEDWMDERLVDLTNQEAIESAIEQIVAQYGRIDILVNNAAIRRFSRIADISDEDWQASVATNLTAPLQLTRKAAPHLVKAQGMIFFIGSHSGEHFIESGVAYSSTKAALRAMAEVALQEFRHQGVRVCHLSLGAIANRPLPDDEWKMLPEDIGQLVLTLLNMPARVTPAYVEMRPSKPHKAPISGLEVLQYI